MIGDAADRYFLPRDALQILHGAERPALAVEDRSLFDVQLYVRMRPYRPASERA